MALLKMMTDEEFGRAIAEAFEGRHDAWDDARALTGDELAALLADSATAAPPPPPLRRRRHRCAAAAADVGAMIRGYVRDRWRALMEG